jgi:hypothetical protein
MTICIKRRYTSRLLLWDFLNISNERTVTPMAVKAIREQNVESVAAHGLMPVKGVATGLRTICAVNALSSWGRIIKYVSN